MGLNTVFVQRATTDDIHILMRHRRSLWLETGPWKEAEVAIAVVEYEKWLRTAVGDGSVVPFLGKIGTTTAGSGSIWIRDIRPAPSRAKRCEPVLIGMYTEPGFRRLKVASSILENAIGWCRANGFDELVLHSSDQARSLYMKFGFTETSELRLRLG